MAEVDGGLVVARVLQERNVRYLFCINAEDGTTAWTDTTRRGSGFAAIISAGSVILALPSSSEMVVFKPDGKAYVEIAKYEVADSPTYAHPIISGKRIFIKDQESIALWTIE